MMSFGLVLDYLLVITFFLEVFITYIYIYIYIYIYLHLQNYVKFGFGQLL